MVRSIGKYRCAEFFTQGFQFSFHRCRHTSEMFNEQVLHQREFWKIIYVVGGHGKKIINGRQYRLQPGGLFFIHPDDQTGFVIESPYVEICNILFMPEMVNAEIGALSDNFGFFTILRPNFQRKEAARVPLHILKSDQNIDRVVKCLENEYTRKQLNYRHLIRYNLMELLLRLCRKAASAKRNTTPENLTAYIEHIIGQYFTEDVDLDFLSRNAGVTKNHLCRVYRSQTGMTIMERLRQLRLQKARTLLIETDLSISDICYDSGFHDLSHFYRCFAGMTGKNPGDYRRLFGQD